MREEENMQFIGTDYSDVALVRFSSKTYGKVGIMFTLVTL